MHPEHDPESPSNTRHRLPGSVLTQGRTPPPSRSWTKVRLKDRIISRTTVPLPPGTSRRGCRQRAGSRPPDARTPVQGGGWSGTTKNDSQSGLHLKLDIQSITNSQPWVLVAEGSVKSSNTAKIAV